MANVGRSQRGVTEGLLAPALMVLVLGVSGCSDGDSTSAAEDLGTPTVPSTASEVVEPGADVSIESVGSGDVLRVEVPPSDAVNQTDETRQSTTVTSQPAASSSTSTTTSSTASSTATSKVTSAPSTTATPTTAASTTAPPTTVSTTAAPTTTSTTVATGDNLGQAEQASLQLLNELRRSLGLGTLEMSDAEMSAFARSWSQNMRENGFRHSSARWSENIVWYSADQMTPSEAAAKFHDMWINSPGHYRNMTKPEWTIVGIGFYHDESGWWGTHVFR